MASQLEQGEIGAKQLYRKWPGTSIVNKEEGKSQGWCETWGQGTRVARLQGGFPTNQSSGEKPEGAEKSHTDVRARKGETEGSLVPGFPQGRPVSRHPVCMSPSLP